jgi:hypothetical protein
MSATGHPASKPRLASTKAEEKIATLRKYYKLGRRASDTSPDGSPKKPESLAKLAEVAGVKSQDTIRKALKFATTYSDGELKELLALRDPHGEPLSWYLVRVLIQVKDKALRAELQERVAREGWSRQDLWDEINARQGKTRRAPKGGRNFALPRNPEQVLRRLVERCESWLRFYKNIGGEGGMDVQIRTAAQSGDQAAGLKELVRQARTKLREVEEQSRKAADQLQRLEPKLKGAGPGSGNPSTNLAEGKGRARSRSESKG